jgi:hypothetical protein
MRGNNRRTMAAPPEVLSNQALRAQFIIKYGRIPVAPTHWSLQEGASDSPASEPPETAHLVQADGPACANCSGPLPTGRAKYCSDSCSDDAKRKAAREVYGHRHRFVCVECGCELHPGRHRK